MQNDENFEVSPEVEQRIGKIKLIAKEIILNYIRNKYAR